MRAKMRLLSVLAILLITIPVTALSHSGRTDSSGGHRDNKNKSGLGSYHYHCSGNPPHLHKNGCPYSKTSTSKPKATKKPSPTTRPSPTPRPTPNPVISKEIDPEVLMNTELLSNLPYRKGDIGDGIIEIQERLISLGYLSDVADGIFGRKTEAAVKYFEEDYDFEVNGVIEEDEFVAIVYWEYGHE